MKLETTEEIIKVLAEKDIVMARLICKYGEIRLALSSNYFESLTSSIVGQQLSNKVADVIWKRLVTLLGGKTGATPSAIKAPSNYLPADDYHISPKDILVADTESLRAVGLSYGKINYIKNLSEAVENGSLKPDEFAGLENEEIIAQLTKIKGIGRWTAEMFLIFSLGRQDVFSLGDGGLYNAIKKLYCLDNPTKADIQQLTATWSPYRTFASLYLWKSLENEPAK